MGEKITTTDNPEQSGDVFEAPVLPLRDVVVYPHMVIPLFVGRAKSIKALNLAMEGHKKIFLLSQKSPDIDDPLPEDLYEIGTLASVLQMLKLPDGTVKVLVEGVERAQLHHYTDTTESLIAQVSLLEIKTMDGRECEALMRTVQHQFESYIKLNNSIPPEIMSSLSGIDDPGRLADTIAAQMSMRIEDKQRLLELGNVKDRLEFMIATMESEIELLQVERKVRGRVKKQMEKSQREYYLNEQMKAIQKELGEIEDAPNEVEELDQRLKAAGMPKEAKEKAFAELNKLKMMSPMSAEASVVRNYLDWMANVPWKKRTKIKHDLQAAEKILEEDHYGLEEVKERILEYLAVQQRVKKMNGPVLCLVGPPGVGKTSLGRSIARATNRKFVRMSLGGVRDEAEIRGHRRTYIGSLPGKIIQNLSKAGTRNPFFLLDEIDKMSMDFRGDPGSALLEALDPEQNDTFGDHYLEVDYDLSEVMFVTTANSLTNIPAPLLDRMEVIRISGYTEDEKLNIAKRYLVPKQAVRNGLKKGELVITDGALGDIIRYYTREAGVRGLDREIAKLCRKTVRRILTKGGKSKSSIGARSLEKYLGVKKYRYGRAEDHDQVGQVTGLAWTEMGGDLLTIEAMVVPGKGKLTITGQLGDVMQESIQAAMTVVRSRSAMLGIESEFYKNLDTHIHVPEGAIPKDGPSAGVGMCTAIVSVLTKIAVRADVAMTGEITLRGEVLPIGGLKEKLLAAHRGGIKVIIIPEENRRDLKEIPKNIIQDLEICPVRWIDEVLEIALQKAPVPMQKKVLESAQKEPTQAVIKKKEKRPRAH